MVMKILTFVHDQNLTFLTIFRFFDPRRFWIKIEIFTFLQQFDLAGPRMTSRLLFTYNFVQNDIYYFDLLLLLY